jgi:glycosyltransferase involved in cell wall biosynthesis
LLEAVASQDFDGALRVIVVDNDALREGLEVCAAVAPGFRFPLISFYQPQPNISATRNATFRKALSEPVDFIATLDDDEWPDDHWLSALVETQRESDSDIVSGRTEAHFAVPPPAWVEQSGAFTHSDGLKMGNLLLRAEMLRRYGEPWFDIGLGLSGGEDWQLFHRLLASGASFAASPAALVYDYVPAERLTLGYIARRCVVVGGMYVFFERNGTLSRPLRARLARAGAKIGYALNHLFWSPRQPLRLVDATEDAGMSLGMFLAEFGFNYKMYDARRRPARRSVGLWGRVPTPLPTPAVRTKRGVLHVSCYDNWGDFDEALHYLTPEGTGVWGDVAFLRGHSPPADWIGIFNNPSPRKISIEHSPNRVFFAIGEPPADSLRPLHLAQGDRTVVLTSDDELCRSPPPERKYVLTPVMTRTWHVRRSIAELRRTRVTDKPLRLSWITSNKSSLVGHRYRLDFLDRLRAAVDFDLFGNGFRPIADKWDALAPYRYSIAFENMRAPYYFTEKLMDCFVAETMPLYYGSNIIERFFPPEAMVIIDPADPDIFAKIDEVIRSDLWLKRKDAILEAKRLVLEEYNLFARLAKFVKEDNTAAMPPRRMRLRPQTDDWK